MTRLRRALADAAREADAAWGPRQHVLALLVVAAALLPLGLDDELRLASFASWAYLALAAVGLAVTVGLAGMPLLAQGALLGIGAVTAAALRDHGWPPLAAAALAAAVAALAGALLGLGLGRLRPAFVAVGTWIVAWIVAFALLQFTSLTGGAEGRVVPAGELAGIDLDATAHWELALLLLVLGALGFAALAGGRAGAALAGLRERPAAALALGVPALHLRTAAFAVAGAYAGLAGGLAVQLDGIADPAGYRPFLSFTLFAAVLIGGTRSASGAVGGTVLVALVFWAADRLGEYADVATGRLDALFAAVLLLGVLAIRSETALPELLPRRRPAVWPGRQLVAPLPARLEARGLSKHFGGDMAVDRLDLTLESGTVTALVGPNGSGKTTALRLLAGTLAADGGVVLLDGDELLPGSPRARALAGIVRTLQATALFGDRTVLDSAVVGAGLKGRPGGVVRDLLATPKARAATREAREVAAAALREVGLVSAADRPATELSGSDQRLLMLAAALAAGPRVLLVDEPSAGASPADVDRIARVLGRVAAGGIAVLVVEHNLRLVRRVASQVVVLDAGRVIAVGTPAAVAADPLVREAYLGRHARAG
ncbi:MAG: ABC transporter permease subunit [Gaiellaceae bacterium]